VVKKKRLKTLRDSTSGEICNPKRFRNTVAVTYPKTILRA
jgi:hypothetical protein